MKNELQAYNLKINNIFINFFKEFQIPLFLKSYDNYSDIEYTIDNTPFYDHNLKNAHSKYTLAPLNIDDLNLNFLKPNKSLTLSIYDNSKLYIYSKLLEQNIPNDIIKKTKLISHNEYNFNNWDGMISLYYNSNYRSSNHKYYISSANCFELIFNNYISPIKPSTLSSILNIFSENKNHPNITSITTNFLTNNTEKLSSKDKVVVYHWLMDSFYDHSDLIKKFSHFNNAESSNNPDLFSESQENFTYLKISQQSLVKNIPLTQGHMADNKDYENVLGFLVKSIKSHVDKKNESNFGITNIFLKNLGIKKNEYLLVLETTDKYNDKIFKQLFHSLLKFYQTQFKEQQKIPDNEKVTFYILSARTNKSIIDNNLLGPQFEYFHLESTLKQGQEVKPNKGNKKI